MAVVPSAESSFFFLRRLRTQAWLVALIPWFIAAPLGLTDRKLPRPHATSYLNGLRGLGCLIVYNTHHAAPWSCLPYGSNPPEESHHWSQLPFINVIWGGQGAVSVFFVLSGYVLTISHLKKISNGRSGDEILQGLCASIIRRGVRLYGPFLTCLAGIIVISRFDTTTWNDGGNGTFFQHAWDYWVRLILPYLNPFTWSLWPGPVSMDHCWTIPVEYRGSLVVLFLCLAVSRTKDWARKFILLFSIYFTLLWNSAFLTAYMLGTFLAELDVSPIKLPSKDSAIRRAIPFTLPEGLVKAITWAIFFFSIFLLGWPLRATPEIEPYKSLIHMFLGKNWGPDDACHTMTQIGAVAVIVTSKYLPAVNKFLSGPLMTYTSEVSFSFYLVHQPILFMVGNRIKQYGMGQLGWSFSMAMWVRYIVCFIIILLIADPFWRGVDEKFIHLARWFSTTFLTSPEQSKVQTRLAGGLNRDEAELSLMREVVVEDKDDPPFTMRDLENGRRA